MVMDTIQIRISKGILEKINELVKAGLYSNRSEVIREATRRYVLEEKKVESEPEFYHL